MLVFAGTGAVGSRAVYGRKQVGPTIWVGCQLRGLRQFPGGGNRWKSQQHAGKSLWVPVLRGANRGGAEIERWAIWYCV